MTTAAYHNHYPIGSGRGGKALKITGIVIGGVVLAVLFALAFGWLVMILWNWLMPALFGIKEITYWQGFGITVLAKILFGGLHGSNHKGDHVHRSVDRRWHRWMGIDDDAALEHDLGSMSREDMKHYRDFWREQGKMAFEEYLRNAQDGQKKEGA
jgi:hypothetical protein